MNRFEQQLSASSKRLASKQLASVPPVPIPTPSRHLSVAWFTTPVAAVAGLLVGLFIQFGTPNPGPANSNIINPSIVMVHDTIIEYVFDTILLESTPLNTQLVVQSTSSTTSTSSAVSPSEQIVSSSASSSPVRSSHKRGKTITEDGIDYSKLISCAY